VMVGKLLIAAIEALDSMCYNWNYEIVREI
jgi:hypothetical protein